SREVSHAPPQPPTRKSTSPGLSSPCCWLTDRASWISDRRSSYLSSRMPGVKVSPTSSPSGSRKRLTICPQGSVLFLMSIRYPFASSSAVALPDTPEGIRVEIAAAFFFERNLESLAIELPARLHVAHDRPKAQYEQNSSLCHPSCRAAGLGLGDHPWLIETAGPASRWSPRSDSRLGPQPPASGRGRSAAVGKVNRRVPRGAHDAESPRASHRISRDSVRRSWSHDSRTWRSATPISSARSPT